MAKSTKAGSSKSAKPKKAAVNPAHPKSPLLDLAERKIGEWLDLYDTDPDHIEQARVLGEKIEKRIAVLERQRKDLEETIEELREIRMQVRDYLTERRSGKEPDRPAAQAL